MEIKVGDWIRNSMWAQHVSPIKVSDIIGNRAYYEFTPEIIAEAQHWYEGVTQDNAYYDIDTDDWIVVKKDNFISRRGVRYVKSR